MWQQSFLLLTLAVTFLLLLWERWRYDLVALAALLLLTLVGIVPAEEAFLGFGHPAVITVAAILVISRAMQNAGVVDLIAEGVRLVGGGFLLQLGALLVLTTFTSAFMNNIGALAVLMPVAIQLAREQERPSSLYLMPLAFASLLGGMSTLIGTPPNIIIATLRGDLMGEPFAMFDYTPVGLGVALAGGSFLLFLGWRLLPLREGKAEREELFSVEKYITELRVTEESSLVGEPLKEVEARSDGTAIVIGLVRSKRKITSPSRNEEMKAGDILIAEADPEAIKEMIDANGLELLTDQTLGKEMLGTADISLMEVVVAPGSRLVKRLTGNLHIRRRTGVSLLAVARQGRRLRERLNAISLRVGDILLLRGKEEDLQDAVSTYGLLPLATQPTRLDIPRRVMVTFLLFSCALVMVACKLLPIQIAFTLAALAMVIYGLVPVRELYRAIDWPIIILLGAMLPVGGALETTGAAQTTAESLLFLGSHFPPELMVGLVLVLTMFLSDIINNAAAAILMAPVAIRIAQNLGVSPDPFIMGVAIGASCAFLTPIGHQSNALVMGPGGYRFSDYWKVGLPLELIIVLVGVPLLLYFWPLGGAF